MELSGALFEPKLKNFFKKSTLKKVVLFSYNIFRETETPKNSIYFRKQNFLIFPEMETLKN